MDGDGDLDVLSAAGNDQIAWYENDGAENFTDHVITTSADSATDVYAADMDGDGDLDVLSASFRDGTIGWYENTGDPHAPILAPIGHKTVDHLAELNFTATAADPDGAGDALTFSLDARAPTGATIDPVTGVFSWTSAADVESGVHWITIRVTDSGVPARDDSETIAITVGEITTFLVNTLADGVDANPGDGVARTSTGATTLRAAIMEASTLAGAQTISLPGGTFALSLAGISEDGGATGDLDITDQTGTLRIVGQNAVVTKIDGAELDRVLHVTDGATLELSGLTITGGAAQGNAGGGIYKRGNSLGHRLAHHRQFGYVG